MLWIARALWIVLAFTIARAIDGASADWSSAARVAIAILGWGAWGVAFLALAAPRPWGFTVLRVAVSAAVIAAIAAASTASAEQWLPALASAVVASGVVTGAAVAHACADGASYGYERRFPLRAPFALLIGGIPLVGALITIAMLVPVLLLADAQWIAGGAAAMVGVPLAVILARALHGLSKRWLIVVPAGCVIADPLTLSDPVLITEDSIASIEPAPARVDQGVTDLRLGTAPGSIEITIEPPYPLVRRTARAQATVVDTDRLAVTPLRPSWFRAMRAQRARAGA